MTTLLVWLAQTLGASVPLVLAALGGCLSERSGVATLALEGYLLAGAFAAAVAALGLHSVAAALLCAALAGALLGGLFAWSTVRLRANAIVAGVALNLLCAAGTRVALKVLYDSASNSPPLPLGAARSGNVGLAALSLVFSQPSAWLGLALSLLVLYAGERSVWGLRVRAAGEHPEALRAWGVSPERVRASALVLGGALGALGGAHLSLGQHQFVAYMSGGRGFLALAAVILGNWQPARVALAAVGIAALASLEASLAGRVALPTVLLQTLPYLVTLVAVVGVVGRTRPPAALGE